jgi:tyrosyl-tRNA synthetase
MQWRKYRTFKKLRYTNSMNKMKLSQELQWRGYYNQATFQNPSELDKGTFTLYLGADPTADSLHVGHLAVYMMVRRFLDHGHKVYLLVGGGTGMIGDPGGRSEERNLQTLEQIELNKKALVAQVSRLFIGQEFELVDNYDWLKDVSILDFLRNTGKHFSVSNLVQRDYIAERIGEGGSGMSFTEFSYTLLQGHDYWHLYSKHDVNLQVGGSDQWGNILSGVDLIRRKEGATVHGMTAPLVINKSNGKKFGKSEGGAIWLSEQKTTVYQFYQFWLNTDDLGVLDYLKLFTMLDSDEIDRIEAETRKNPALRMAQKTLAYEVTKLVHGQKRADSVRRVSEVLFGSKTYHDLQTDDIEELKKELPSVDVKAQTDLVEVLVLAGLASSKSDANRGLEQGAIYINGNQALSGQTVSESDALTSGYAIIRRGKNANVILHIK